MNLTFEDIFGKFDEILGEHGQNVGKRLDQRDSDPPGHCGIPLGEIVSHKVTEFWTPPI